MRISDWSSDVCSSDLAATETIDRKLIDRMDFRRRWLPGPAAEVDRRNARAAGFWQQVHAQVALAEQLPVEYLEHAIEQRLGNALSPWPGQRQPPPLGQAKLLGLQPPVGFHLPAHQN